MTINSIGKDTQVYNSIKKDLNAASLTGRVISNNIANINTKDYKRFDVVFKEALNEETQDTQMKRTNEKHIQDGYDSDGIKVVEDTTTSMRYDGNNVDIESEKTNQAANSILYNTLISQLNSRISNTRYVITSGGR